mmetsp:Transcript_3667/g.14421  ORF Transcript_3667/g.14421 Transcript_3667/m.14421 type:complete len:143 (+) Transcript_3667:1157-1585(+)
MGTVLHEPLEDAWLEAEALRDHAGDIVKGSQHEFAPGIHHLLPLRKLVGDLQIRQRGFSLPAVAEVPCKRSKRGTLRRTTFSAASWGYLVLSGRGPTRQKKRHLGSAPGGASVTGRSFTLYRSYKRLWSRGFSTPPGVTPTW